MVAQFSAGQSAGMLRIQYDRPAPTGVCVVVHGHFYQPPRENPYLDIIERQPSAYPYHDWNERIHYECYRPNAFARVLSEAGEVLDIVNNFEYLSFNVGPTLMSWLERHDPEVYQAILTADRNSARRCGGHGNAIAQTYNHIILPLADERDKYTQIRWAKADFRSHFGRDPEGLWLAETAVDYPTLEVLAAENIRFIILAPSQTERCRPLPSADNPDPDWQGVENSEIDATRPYRCFLDDGKFVDIFFYDGPISADLGFEEDILFSAYNLAGRLHQAIRHDQRPSQLLGIATDGETFGHHKGGTEKCIAYSFTHEFPQQGWTVTNFAQYLSLNPPTWEVVLKPVTAWSCSHGVARWQDDCGCGGGGGWQQQWRRPLRDSLDWLRDRLRGLFERQGSKFFRDPWRARDEYVQAIRDRDPENIGHFLDTHQSHALSASDQVNALRLLEMQRQSLLMFTSCGWFFDELSRPEGVQILRYAARAIELANEVAGVELEREFRDRLAAAPSNVAVFENGGAIYDALVVPARIDFERVAAHYAITALFVPYQSEDRVYCYRVQQLDYQRQVLGALSLAVGHISLTSEVTWERREFVFVVLHLGGWDFHCCIQPFGNRKNYSQMQENLFSALASASVAKLMVAITQWFGDRAFDLESLFAEERQWLMAQLTEKTRTGLDQIYSQIYRDNYSILRAFHREELPVPPELQVAAELAIANRGLQAIEKLTQAAGDRGQIDNALNELAATAVEAEQMRCHLAIPGAKTALETWIYQWLDHLLVAVDPETIEADCQRLAQVIAIATDLSLGLALDRVQERYFFYVHQKIVPMLDKGGSSGGWTRAQSAVLLSLGQRLGVDVSPWL
ncbi:MAG: DUF3536 domain-containing protein [Spirulinaceae cyanobacterium SM2_1_0]|nr:DUF3536 domain-containing protein [Spirulinaceae cyanobacterium SM2_1_0]